MSKWLLLVLLFVYEIVGAKVDLGIDRFFSEGYDQSISGKKVGLITNQTGVNSKLQTTTELFKKQSKLFTLAALFSPEHGINGKAYAWEKVSSSKKKGEIPIYSLHGETRRPTDEMLKGIDVLVYDIQDNGCRAYTYCTTLCYAMEEAAKRKIPVIVLDRPNPQTGVIVDGPMLDDKWRSYIGYINVPYCHGMTIGELAHFFNDVYQVGCQLKVIPMKGWKREMLFRDTGLSWIPPSPHIPEDDTPLYCASTGILGELGIVSIGVGYTLPFKVIGAPWIDAENFSAVLNGQKLPGVTFSPIHYRPFYGMHKGEDCQGVKINITDPLVYKPLSVQYLLLGVLKSLYEKQMLGKIKGLSKQKKDLFCKANGTDKILDILTKEKYISWKLIEFQRDDRGEFMKKRQKYLLY